MGENHKWYREELRELDRKKQIIQRTRDSGERVEGENSNVEQYQKLQKLSLDLVPQGD